MIYLMYDIYRKENGTLSPEQRCKDLSHNSLHQDVHLRRFVSQQNRGPDWLGLRYSIERWSSNYIKDTATGRVFHSSFREHTFRELCNFYYHFTSSHYVHWNVPVGLFSFPFSSLKAIVSLYYFFSVTPVGIESLGTWQLLQRSVSTLTGLTNEALSPHLCHVSLRDLSYSPTMNLSHVNSIEMSWHPLIFICHPLPTPFKFPNDY